jgi:hypothetical protein
VKEYLLTIILPMLLAIGLFLELMTRLRSLPLALFLAVICFGLLVYLMYALQRWAANRRQAPPLPDPRAALKECRARVAAIGQLVRDPSLAKHPRREVRESARATYVLLARIVEALRLDENKRAAAPAVLEKYIAPTHELLREYVKLSSRGIETAEEELAAAESALPVIERRLDNLFNRLHEDDIISLAVINEMVGESLLVADESQSALSRPGQGQT